MAQSTAVFGTVGRIAQTGCRVRGRTSVRTMPCVLSLNSLTLVGSMGLVKLGHRSRFELIGRQRFAGHNVT
jgi:hypothetical protein